MTFSSRSSISPMMIFKTIDSRLEQRLHLTHRSSHLLCSDGLLLDLWTYLPSWLCRMIVSLADRNAHQKYIFTFEPLCKVWLFDWILKIVLDVYADMRPSISSCDQ
jgi:hypothetical protein